MFGLEDSRGLGRALAQWLVAQGFIVKEINPVHARRERLNRPDPDKSDAKDARAIAEVLYRNWTQLPIVEPDGRHKALSQAIGVHEQFTRQTARLKNQLHALLHEQYPDYKAFFSDPFGATGRAFFRAFPSPRHLHGYGVRRLAEFLNRHASNLGVGKAQAILGAIDKAASRDRATDARDVLIPALIDQTEFIERQLVNIDQEITSLLDEGEQQLRTMSGVGNYLGAVFESEIRDIDRFPSSDQLARYAGIAPAETSSGARHRQRHRPYGRRRLNHAFYLLALCRIRRTPDGRFLCPEGRRYYQKKLDEGKSRKAALRCLMRRLVDIVYALMRDRSAYRPPQHPVPDTEVVQSSSISVA